MGERIGVVVIHGVGETEPGWTNDYFIKHLVKRDKNLVFDDHNEVHRLPDSGRSRKGFKFPAYVRRGTLGDGKSVTVVELCWSDLSRVGHSALAGFFVMIQLFYEAPLVLGAAFLRQTQTGLRAMLASIIRFANWLLRWPITGLNVSAFLVAVGVLVIEKLRGITELTERIGVWITVKDVYVYAVCLLLGAVAAWSLWFARRNVHKGVLLTDLALSTAIFSSLLFVLALGAGLLGFGGALDGPAPFLWYASKPILVLWWVWNHVVVAGIVLLFLMVLGKLFNRGGLRLSTLMRPASALGLSMIQGMIWKILITLLWVLLISALVPNTVTVVESISGSVRTGELVVGTIPSDICEGHDYCAGLRKLSSDLFAIFVMNSALAAVLGLGVLSLIGVRSLVAKARRKSLMAGHARLPRLIVSPWLIVLMFALTIFNFVVYMPQIYDPLLDWAFGSKFPDPLRIYPTIHANLFANGFIAYFVGTASLLIYIFFFRAMQNASRGVLHIVRDLVDHQYTPEFTLSRFMLPAGKNRRGKFPRQERIQKRLDELMQHMERERCHHLVLVAHSQGTVVLHDYLRSKKDDRTLDQATRIDIVTVGSPLGHFYRHYFPAYESVTMTAAKLNPKLASWTNLYRIDDPIGAKVTVVTDDFIRNIALSAGGHVDYWKEAKVCDAILDLIDPARSKDEGAAESPTATATQAPAA